MILCVTPNPAIDRTLHVNSLHVGEVHRTDNVLVVAGGKGLNVARTIRGLGGEPFCMGLIGGHTGNLLADLAQEEGLAAYWTPAKNETRTCIIVVENGRDATVINERGADVSEAECLSLCEHVWEVSARADIVCVSGSLPPGFSSEIFQSLLSGLVKRRKSVWVDTSGQALSTALNVNGINIKVNAGELGEVLGMEIFNAEQVQKVGAQLRGRGVASVVVTMGKDGALWNSSAGVWFAKPPQVETVSSVGSGDAFLGGLAFALEKDYLPEAALRCGVAAGAANALHFGGGVVKQGEIEEIYKAVRSCRKWEIQ